MTSLSEVLIVVGMVAAMGEGRQLNGADMRQTGEGLTTGMGIKQKYI